MRRLRASLLTIGGGSFGEIEGPEVVRVGHDGKIELSGWCLRRSHLRDERVDDELVVWLDGEPISTVKWGLAREDVLTKYPFWKGSLWTGFEGRTSVGLRRGAYVLSLVVSSPLDERTVLEKEVVLEDEPPMANIDCGKALTVRYDNTVDISGWCLPNPYTDVGLPPRQLRVLLDGQPVGSVQWGRERRDVGLDHADIVDSSRAGFEGRIAIGDRRGQCELAVELTADGSRRVTSEVVLEDEPPMANIDCGKALTVRYDNTVDISGWCLPNPYTDVGLPPRQLRVLLDGQPVGSVQWGRERRDVGLDHADIVDSSRAGFEGRIAIGDRRGQCELAVELTVDGSRRVTSDVVLREADDAEKNRQRFRDLEVADLDPSSPRIGNLPLRLFIEVTTACQLRCIMCRYDIKARNVPTNLFLSNEHFQSLDSVIPHLKTMNLSGWGEPTLHPEYERLLERARGQNASLELTLTSHFNHTSAQTMHALLDNEVTNVTVSIDGATPGTYGTVRVRGSLEKLLANVRAFVEIKSATGRRLPRLTYEFVVQKANVREIEAFVDLVHELGGRHADLEEVTGMQHLEVDFVEHIGEYQAAKRRAAELGIRLFGRACDSFEKVLRGDGTEDDVADPGSEPAPADARVPVCHEPFQTAYIQADGTVSPCCFSARRLGDLSEQTLEKVWFGEEATRLRSEVLEGRLDSWCRVCVGQRRNAPKLAT